MYDSVDPKSNYPPHMLQLAVAILELLEKRTNLPGKKTINRLLWVNLRFT